MLKSISVLNERLANIRTETQACQEVGRAWINVVWLRAL